MKRLLGLVCGLALVSGMAGCCYKPGVCDPHSGCYHGGCWEPMSCRPLGLFGWLSGHQGCHHGGCRPCAWQGGGGGCACDCCGTCCPGGACGFGPGYPMSSYGAYPYAGEEPVYDISESDIHSGDPIYPDGTPEQNRAPLPEPAPNVQPMGGYQSAQRPPMYQSGGYAPQAQGRPMYHRPQQWGPTRY